MQSIFHIQFYVSFTQQHCEVGPISISQMKKVSLEKYHKTSKW